MPVNVPAPPGTLERTLRIPGGFKQLVKLSDAEVTEDFWTYRQRINTDGFMKGWWQEVAARHMQMFWEDYVAGKRPKLLLQAPPQHGKSTTVEDFVTWVSGKDPSLKTIYASYSDDLGVTRNLAIQRTMTSSIYKKIFRTRINERGEGLGGWLRNQSIVEFVGHSGSFRNTTVEGQITGLGLDMGLIDDPMKGRKEASSETKRNSTWNWLTDDFFSRFSDKAAMLMIMTRWHVDDPVGRWLERFPDTKVLKFAAIATDPNDWTVKAGYRDLGEALFPEFKSVEFLAERRKAYTNAAWESLYQQNPIVVGGGIFPIEQFSIQQSVPRGDIKKSVRYWDKAATEDGGAYTAGVLMHELKNGQFYIEDVQRGQWNALTRERRIKQQAEIDKKVCPRVSIYIEQEPGSGGKESAEATVRMLRGYKAFADKVTGDKEFRAEPYAAQVQGGNVLMLAADWNRAFMNEHEEFPSGKYKDQVDAASGAFNNLIKGSTYDSTYSWVG